MSKKTNWVIGRVAMLMDMLFIWSSGMRYSVTWRSGRTHTLKRPYQLFKFTLQSTHPQLNDLRVFLLYSMTCSLDKVVDTAFWIIET